MSPAEVAQIVRLRVAAEIVREREAIERLVASIAALAKPAADARDEWMRARALAFDVERFYTAVESLLVRTLRALDGDAPQGPMWHLELLRAAGVNIAGGRPALLSESALIELRELLKFRHLARHGYETDPDLARMNEHAATVGRASVALQVSLDRLDLWLRDG